mmetsp:Transcript_1825/g.3824  ORF Transcript_1825/g.3824 Transcript_1825/m.3824 type:complete len:223 (-) Transcript_1825:222-890(-)
MAKPRFNELKNEGNDNISREKALDSVSAVNSPNKRSRKLYPWRSDLQKKRIEKARESRSRNREIAMKQTKRVLSIWKKKKKKTKKHEVVVEETTPRNYGNLRPKEKENTNLSFQEERQPMADSHKPDDINHREMHCPLLPHDGIVNGKQEQDLRIDTSNLGTHLMCYPIDDPEMNISDMKISAMYSKPLNIDYGTDCDHAFQITEVCSPIMTDQRQDQHFFV